MSNRRTKYVVGRWPCKCGVDTVATSPLPTECAQPFALYHIAGRYVLSTHATYREACAACHAVLDKHDERDLTIAATCDVQGDER